MYPDRGGLVGCLRVACRGGVASSKGLANQLLKASSAKRVGWLICAINFRDCASPSPHFLQSPRREHLIFITNSCVYLERRVVALVVVACINEALMELSLSLQKMQ